MQRRQRQSENAAHRLAAIVDPVGARVVEYGQQVADEGIERDILIEIEPTHGLSEAAHIGADDAVTAG